MVVGALLTQTYTQQKRTISKFGWVFFLSAQIGLSTLMLAR